MTENGILGTYGKGSRIFTAQFLTMRPDFLDIGRTQVHESLKTQTLNDNFLHSGLPKTVDISGRSRRVSSAGHTALFP
jgi:hypothetical protein